MAEDKDIPDKDLLAAGLNVLSAVSGCLTMLVSHLTQPAPLFAAGPHSRLERLVRAAEGFVEAKKREADGVAALAAAQARQAAVDEANSARFADRHAFEIIALRRKFEVETYRIHPTETPAAPPATS